ncbi:plant expansin [Coniophora puteana RWD-64-598 SS2]|uniref:Plant expansin n=1 Tax=Coniophora puteana (strain RWD-64-598) TaxID=741705 RepID=A0A5M3MRT6_CONPW|nr:plant expansin [Coniophora puteana RWD-64-598 SS2]EIW81868.1 plant expansin [Coniophora puteana RWD-64-598 SS2]
MFFSKALVFATLAVAGASAAVIEKRQSYLTGTQTGEGTSYAVGTGACGVHNVPSDLIVAVSQQLFDTYPGYKGGNPNNNPVCGKKIKANYQGKSVTVTVEDRCTGCALTDLDFSTGAFEQLAPLSVGRLHGMTWTWV